MIDEIKHVFLSHIHLDHAGAAWALAEQGATIYLHPFGKTHLAHAIGVEIKDKYPEKTVLYISAEIFTQQYIDSVKKNNRNDFIHFYQLIDVLIIDDVQFLSGKSGTQDVFFHIFNHLHQNGKQVILTSDKAPVDMQDIEQRLLSRFKWGLSAELHQPDYETRTVSYTHLTLPTNREV